MNGKKIAKRIFIVGCPRSGTTLLQSYFASDKRFFSFPESHFFETLYPSKKHTFYNRFKLASPYCYLNFFRFLKSISSLKYLGLFLFKSPLINAKIRNFFKCLDTIALSHQKQYWVEKTPNHLHYIEVIEQHIEDAHFIHIVRRGDEVTASLFKVTKQYPSAWNGKRNVEQCVDRWINDIKITMANINKENHHLIRYENLIDNPQEEIEKIYKKINVSFDGSSLNRENESLDHILTKEEVWKKESLGPVVNNRNSKFEKLLSEEERELVLRKISDEGISVSGI